MSDCNVDTSNRFPIKAWTKGVSVGDVAVEQLRTLRVTPAMALGITNHIWSIGELIETAIMGATPEPEGRRVGPFRVIDGGQN